MQGFMSVERSSCLRIILQLLILHILPVSLKRNMFSVLFYLIVVRGFSFRLKIQFSILVKCRESVRQAHGVVHCDQFDCLLGRPLTLNLKLLKSDRPIALCLTLVSIRLFIDLLEFLDHQEVELV